MKKKAIGHVAVESVVTGGEKLARAKRLQKLGQRITAAADHRQLRRDSAQELSEHRKSIHSKKLAGLETALEQRKQTVKQAKENVKFAEKGYGFRDRRAQVSRERDIARAQIAQEQGAAGKGIGGMVERIGRRAEAKTRAEAAVAAREKAAADELELRQAKLDLARARRTQTRTAYWKTKAHVGGNHANRHAVRRDMVEDTDTRLSDLRLRDSFNRHMNKGEFQARRVDAANQTITNLTPEAPVPIPPIIEQTPHEPAPRSEAPSIDFSNIGDFVPGATAAFVEAAREQHAAVKAARSAESERITPDSVTMPTGKVIELPPARPIDGQTGSKAA